jgi:hypothetical protein
VQRGAQRRVARDGGLLGSAGDVGGGGGSGALLCRERIELRNGGQNSERGSRSNLGARELQKIEGRRERIGSGEAELTGGRGGGGERAGDPAAGQRRLHRCCFLRAETTTERRCGREREEGKDSGGGSNRRWGRRERRGGYIKDWRRSRGGEYNGNMTVVSRGGRRRDGDWSSRWLVAVEENRTRRYVGLALYTSPVR